MWLPGEPTERSGLARQSVAERVGADPVLGDALPGSTCWWDSICRASRSTSSGLSLPKVARI